MSLLRTYYCDVTAALQSWHEDEGRGSVMVNPDVLGLSSARNKFILATLVPRVHQRVGSFQ